MKPFLPGGDYSGGSSRVDAILRRILALSEADVSTTLEQACAGFVGRHRDLEAILETHFDTVVAQVGVIDGVSEARRLLIGAYFSHEYSVEAAALGNPSIVQAPDQSGLAAGEIRFVMSLRAIGEGHVSSIEFRTGVIGADLEVRCEELSGRLEGGKRVPAEYKKGFFETKLRELGALDDLAGSILDDLEPEFGIAQLEAAIDRRRPNLAGNVHSQETIHFLHWLASSNYRIGFAASSSISERVIFPAGPTESRGMEDVRLVRFVHDDGRVVYYGTYTAFDGHQILPQLLETTDFESFRIATLSGECAQNKGMALFPRKLDGDFVALGRHDNVNNFLMRSDDVRVWRETEKIQEPEQPWELTQLGNNGSPLETEAGWLVITHGVGPFRQYSLGALLLDLDDPSRVIGHLKEPLLSPDASEREGYVPNVVYSCGSMIVGEHLVLPYGFADVGASLATIRVDHLLSRLQPR
jgi:predicted GH43/DUF377 family glycosyl hydrolase